MKYKVCCICGWSLEAPIGHEIVKEMRRMVICPECGREEYLQKIIIDEEREKEEK